MARYTQLMQLVIVRLRRMQVLLSNLTKKKPLLVADVKAVITAIDADLKFIRKELPEMAQAAAIRNKGRPLAEDERAELTGLIGKAVERLTTYYQALRMSIAPLSEQLEKGYHPSRIIEVLRQTFYVGGTLFESWAERQNLLAELREAEGLIAMLSPSNH
jgi:hypothetical protein